VYPTWKNTTLIAAKNRMLVNASIFAVGARRSVVDLAIL
jgi:hypothetical protein